MLSSRADRLSRSFTLFTRTLQYRVQAGVTVHLCDVPGAVLDAGNGQVRWIIELLARFASYDRRMVQLRSRESARELQLPGRRHCRIAPYGFRWEKRGSSNYIVENAEEQGIIRRVVELASEGWSMNQIRQRLIDSKVKNRKGKPFGPTELRNISIRGPQRLLAREADAL